MKRETAKNIHYATGFAYWIENPDWFIGNPVSDTALRAVRALPFGLYEATKKAFYDTSKVIAVSGESVVVANGADKVDKFMFRYPGKMPLDVFRDRVSLEAGVVTSYLAGIALPTQVSIKQAQIFRNPQTQVSAVTQTQERLDLGANPAIDMDVILAETASPCIDKTARDLEVLVQGVGRLLGDHGYYPDIAHSAGNLRRNSINGAVKLIDIMPLYETGTRLIGDRPANVIPHIQENIQAYQEFVGQYGG